MTFKCKDNCGECCGIVPIPTHIYAKNRDKIQQLIENEMVTEEETFPITKDLICCFLTKNKKCSIYEERPEVCQKYGQCDDLPCPHLNKSGNSWSIAKAKRISRKIIRDVDSAMQSIKKTGEQQR